MIKTHSSTVKARSPADTQKNSWRRILTTSSDGRLDRVFLLLVLLVAAYGTIMVFSSGRAYAKARYSDEAYFIKRQLLWLGAGICAMSLSSHIRISCIKRLTPYAYMTTLALLVVTLLFGFSGNGAQRWISIGPLTIQPSEIAKLTMTMMLARYFADNEKSACEDKRRSVSLLHGTLIPIGIMLLPIILVMLQKHLSCIIILGTIGLCLIVMSGTSLRYLGIFTAIGSCGVGYIALFTDYTKSRITVWIDPEAYKLTGGWQTLQGLMAIGSGGLLGKGLGNGELKYCYVSEPANDMIFAILCEELGFVGALFALALFCLLIIRALHIAHSTSDAFSLLLTLGISAKIALQVLLNVAVVTNTIPNTGISLPFFSYGGSSLVMLFFEMGMILSVSRGARIKK